MTTAAVLLAAGGGSRYGGPTHKLLAPWGAGTVFGAALSAAVAAGLDEVIVVDGAVDLSGVVAATASPVPVTVVTNERWGDGVAGSLRRGVDLAREHGHGAVVVGLGDQPALTAATWSAVAAVDAPVVAASFAGDRRPPTRLAAAVWDLLPTDGDEGARALMRDRPDLVVEVSVAGDPRDVDEEADLLTADDLAYVEQCLGRPPRAAFTIAARDADGRPTVIANPPFLDDGTPMPTTYWLVDPDLNRRIGTLEAEGGVNRAEADIGLAELAAVHARYAARRDAMIDDEHLGPRPSGGVGGTRVGVKCLHTHYAAYLAGTDDPVGVWVHQRLSPPATNDEDVP